ncbi:carbohydrate ABC transporter substrate-binding protein [Streptomyces sp. NA04227]|uniref:carbohydrate ABC transporter substrate-binding protein n=1 Tax=Streptomyces sp. NA04227 TaxID=2742136 RepID=UPI0015907418|nr:carbohydrate ABC transporter substrate-binding protein [Streptomyces sp. NA04227]QKW10367.1 carbohydrate ABC transporter substrate-binding protein [Streptomyces sp. NA04227]
MSHKGLTWDHPRGRDALVAAARAATENGLELVWDTHPLEGFESTPIEQLAEEYDVIVLDHPHLGDALKHRCLRPLDELFDPDTVESWRRGASGPSLASYELDGHLWALPLDAATQVAATRLDLAGAAPTLWREVVELAARAPVALSLAGPHALLTFASVCVALGEEPGTRAPGFVSEPTGRRALELMTALAGRAPARSHTMNPIALLGTMTQDDTLAHCPLVYGYVNYASPGLERRVTFTDAPRLTPDGRPGSTLGGTGLALTRRCDPTPELLAHLRELLSPQTQEEFIPVHAGQPAMASAWRSEQVDRAAGGFYSGTRETVSRAWVRPRHAGYIRFQTEGAQVVREVVLGRTSAASGLRRLDELFTTGKQEATR